GLPSLKILSSRSAASANRINGPSTLPPSRLIPALRWKYVEYELRQREHGPLERTAPKRFWPGLHPVERLEHPIHVVGQLVQDRQWIGSSEWIFGEPKPALSILFQQAFEVFGHLADVPKPVQSRGLFLLASDLHPPPGRQLDLCAQPVTVEI